MTEKFVDSISKGLCTLLLQSNLPTLFWGAAAHYFADMYNHIPHSALGDRLPIAEHTGITPDVSWFRAFGCAATVFRGSDMVDHHKLAPSGEQGVFVGLGMSQGRKSWLVWCPRLNCIFSTSNVTFDDTFFPMKTLDQRV